SRRRHTRSKRDWSSDVCSSDLKYEFTHSTFANYWRRGHRNLPAVLVSNQMAISTTEMLVADLEQADFKNCIIYGSNQQELVLEKIGRASCRERGTVTGRERERD